MIIDMQKGFINTNTRDIIQNIEKLRKIFKPENCILTKFINTPNSMYVKDLNWRRLINEDEQRFVVDIEPENYILVKTTYSAINLKLKDYLEKRNISKVYLCGVDIDSCVLATAFGLFDLGIEPVFVIDCCASSGGEEMLNSSMRIIKRSFGNNSVTFYREIVR